MLSRLFSWVGLQWMVLAVTGMSWAGHGDPDADMPVWPFAVGTIAAVGVAAIWSTRRRP